MYYIYDIYYMYYISSLKTFQVNIAQKKEEEKGQGKQVNCVHL